jgi:hypothetical protein
MRSISLIGAEPIIYTFASRALPAISMIIKGS